MHAYAQTSVQLFNQLQRQAYSSEDLRRIYACYELAMPLFAGRYTASGKTFIAHLVGTASVLAAHGAPVSTVAAGLLHSVYANGDFGGWRRGISRANRAEVRRTMGSEVEEYVYRFATLLWTYDSMRTIHDELDHFDAIGRTVVFMRLADWREHHLDHGILYRGDGASYQQVIPRIAPALVGMAERLGFPALGAELSRALSEAVAIEIPAELRRRPDAHFVLVPRSYKRRVPAATYQALRRLRWAMRARLRV